MNVEDRELKDLQLQQSTENISAVREIIFVCFKSTENIQLIDFKRTLTLSFSLNFPARNPSALCRSQDHMAFYLQEFLLHSFY